MKNILFRVDSGPQIGAGHMMRCLSLAEQFDLKGFKISFAHKGNESSHLKFIPQTFEKIIIPSKLSYQEEPDLINSVFKHEQLAIAIFDHYHLSADYERAVTAQVKLCIDDFTDRLHATDLYFNPNAQLGSRDVVAGESYREIISGEKYALLNSRFIDYRKKVTDVPQVQKIQKILVFFSLSDQFEVIEKFVHAIPAEELDRYSFTFPLIRDSRSWHFLNEFKESTNCHFKVIEPVKDFIELMTKHDFFIGSSGSSSWERACLGIPSAVINLVDNQRLVTQTLKQKAWAHIIGDQSFSARSVEELFKSIIVDTQLLNTFVKNGFEGVDSLGSKRVYQKVVQYLT